MLEGAVVVWVGVRELHRCRPAAFLPCRWSLLVMGALVAYVGCLLVGWVVSVFYGLG